MEKGSLSRAKMRKGKSPHFLPAGSTERPGNLIDQQAEEDSLSNEQWEDQWQEFLRTVESPHSGWGIPHMPEKQSPWEDPKAFLASFEQVAEACQWPQEEWVIRLLPALNGEAAEAFNSLDVPGREDYGRVKAAILGGDVHHREKQRQQFRRFCYLEAEGPQEAYRRLWEMCRRWLRVENHSKEQILEILVLEQLLSILPPGMQSWVRESNPESCFQAVALAEEFLLSQEEQAATTCLSEAGEPPSVSGWGHPLKEIKEEEEGEAILLGVDEQNEDQEDKRVHWLALGMTTSEEVEGNFWNQGEPKWKEGSLSFQGRNFHKAIHVSKETYTCLECGIHLPNKTEYDFHSQTHRRKKTYRCAECGKSFLHPSTLLLHHNTHTGKKPYNCCGKGFSNKKNLRRHQRRHQEGKPFECSECGKKYSWLANLQEHQRIHTGEKVFECSVCGRRFSRKAHLVGHRRSHAGENSLEYSEGEEEKSNQSDHLQQRKTIIPKEKPVYECLDCGKTFRCMGNFRHHRRTHTDEKPFECPECGECFKWAIHLQMHRKIHKALECPDCGRKFYRKCNFRQHRKIHRKENSVSSQPAAETSVMFQTLNNISEATQE